MTNFFKKTVQILVVLSLIFAVGCKKDKNEDPKQNFEGEPEMILVEGGTFIMGGTDDEFWEYEFPTHQVTLTNYYISKFPVTQKLWKEVMGTNPSYFADCDDCPVETVSWEDAQAFITKLNELTGKNYRLPTEAEWEYAARGGNQSKGYKYSGSNNVDDVAWWGENSAGKLHPVGTKAPNELGICDMSGNVWEWCYDWSANYTDDSQTNPQGPAEGTHRATRGGSWSFPTNYCRISFRGSSTPDWGDSKLGFRVVLPLKQNFEGEPEMILVEGGIFTMGGTDDEFWEYEFPTHQVTLTNYYISKFPVTQKLWKEVMGTNPSEFADCDDCPVETVSWEDAQAFITKLNVLTGKNYRLPTEAEWEYAARGGNQSKGYKYSGSNNIDDVAWYGENSAGKLHSVGTKAPNELGIYDMSGNVWEWCHDWSANYTDDSQTNPQGPAEGIHRATRGGSWYYPAEYCRVSFRGSSTPDWGDSKLGFRVVLSL